MTSQQLNKVIATTIVVGVGTIVAVSAASFVEQIRRDRAARKAYEAISEVTKKIDDEVTNEQFERIIRENDL